MILPKELREKAGIREGDKLAILRWSGGCDVEGLLLVRSEALAQLASEMFGPLMQEILRSGTGGRKTAK